MHAHKLHPVTPLPRSTAHAPEASPGDQGVDQLIATVADQAEDGWWLDDGHQRRLARRAASCLLAPAVGDRVWAVGGEAHGLYVLAVLERAEGSAPATLAFDGDLAVRTEGRLTLSAHAGMELHTPRNLGVSSDELTVQARQGRAAIQELSLLCRRVFASLSRVTRVGEVLELFVDRVLQRSKHSMRAIEGLDRTSAGALELEAEGAAHVKATHALVNGKELVKMDGGQIHLG
ncbi:DUF3540 domain-containing protein [Paraliomyxa miuraensis]|uniref:DUF3540 domain-containing protein n=1 Tax=Paraliomyxa miuraensis TaxID=376150 RepID=UPI002256B8FA|nr:DUF3540 domain-containing protein [Paraliomyxa miuraensis]MCX4247160.1 DUF3540 domain-containing protein [Paraliomyxa miuraensis]